MTEREYQEALEEIFIKFPSFQVVGGRALKPGLGNMIAIDNLLGSPSKRLKFIHIAGTNGKGSVSSMIAAALMQLPADFAHNGGGEQSLKIGLYTSPHLADFRERIRLNGNMIEKEWVYNFLNTNRDMFEKIGASFFEITTAMAFAYFAENKADYVVLECGLGGRLDSTNIVTPMLSVITNIGLDHCQYLGNSLEEIAFEKAGIIKPSLPVVIGESGSDSVKRVFIDKASSCQSDIYFADNLNPFNPFPDDVWRSFNCSNKNSSGNNFKSVLSLATSLLAAIELNKMDLQGDYQQKNIKTVSMALAILLDRILQESGKDLSESTLAAAVYGIENAAKISSLRGRWEVLSTEPMTVCDIGHNSHGMRLLMPQVERAAKEHFAKYATAQGKEGKLYMVFGIMQDKDITAEVEFLPKKAHYIYVNTKSERAMPAAQLKEIMDGYGFDGRALGSIDEALAWLKENASKADFIFIGGSSYVVAEAITGFF